jgi:thiamine-phosphate pyrophosphorylase
LASEQCLGYSTHNLAQALEADRGPVDYIAVGPVFATATKADAEPPLGLDGLREICGRLRKPVVAIGGITLESAAAVLGTGAASIAVIGDLLRHGDVARRTREWMACVEGR